MSLGDRIQTDIERISKTVADLATSAREPGFNRSSAMARHVSHFYTALESCLKKKLQMAGFEPPAESDRHHQATLKLAVEKGMIPRSCLHDVADLLSFRHWDRHAYGMEVRNDLIDEKAVRAERVWAEIKPLWLADLEKGRDVKVPDNT